MVFCDMSKAFDRVWHKGLIFKLQQYGISGDLLNWIYDYLHDRNKKLLLDLACQILKGSTPVFPRAQC